MFSFLSSFAFLPVQTALPTFLLTFAKGAQDRNSSAGRRDASKDEVLGFHFSLVRGVVHEITVHPGKLIWNSKNAGLEDDFPFEMVPLLRTS